MRDLNPGAMQPNFRQEEFQVTQVDKGAVTVKSTNTGKVYLRNSTHLKKLKDACSEEDATAQPNDYNGSNEAGPQDDDRYSGTSCEAAGQVDSNTDDTADKCDQRPKRASRLPNKFQDFVMNIDE